MLKFLGWVDSRGKVDWDEIKVDIIMMFIFGVIIYIVKELV